MSTLRPSPRPGSVRVARFAMLVTVPCAAACGGDDAVQRRFFYIVVIGVGIWAGLAGIASWRGRVPDIRMKTR